MAKIKKKKDTLKEKRVKETESSKWFKGLLKKSQIGKSIRDQYTESKVRRLIKPGQMISFKYPNPKTPLKYLKFFDAQPLDIILYVKGRHMLCLNIHYLTKVQKEILLSMIIKINKQRIRKNQRLKLEYKDIVSFLRSHDLMFCIKKYLVNRIQGLNHIPYKDWKHAIDLKSEKFVFYEGYSMRDIQSMIRKSIKASKANKRSNKRSNKR